MKWVVDIFNGEKLREERKRADLTLQELAMEICIRIGGKTVKAHCWNWENRGNEPRRETLMAICEILKIKPESLFIKPKGGKNDNGKPAGEPEKILRKLRRSGTSGCKSLEKCG